MTWLSCNYVHIGWWYWDLYSWFIVSDISSYGLEQVDEFYESY